MGVHDENSDTAYSPGLISREGEDLLVIEDLTEGEVHWVGGQMSERLDGSLARAGEMIVPRSRVFDHGWDSEID